jgi:hypothetical protein
VWWTKSTTGVADGNTIRLGTARRSRTRTSARRKLPGRLMAVHLSRP